MSGLGPNIGKQLFDFIKHIFFDYENNQKELDEKMKRLTEKWGGRFMIKKEIEITTCIHFNKGIYCSKFGFLAKKGLSINCSSIERCNQKGSNYDLCKDCRFNIDKKCINVHCCIEGSRYEFTGSPIFLREYEKEHIKKSEVTKKLRNFNDYLLEFLSDRVHGNTSKSFTSIWTEFNELFKKELGV